AHLAVHAAPLEEGELDGELEGVPRGVVDRDLQPLHARPHRLPRRVLPHPEQQPARRTAALQLPAHRPEHVPVALRQRGAAQVAPLDRRAPLRERAQRLQRILGRLAHHGAPCCKTSMSSDGASGAASSSACSTAPRSFSGDVFNPAGSATMRSRTASRPSDSTCTVLRLSLRKVSTFPSPACTRASSGSGCSPCNTSRLP